MNDISHEGWIMNDISHEGWMMNDVSPEGWMMFMKVEWCSWRLNDVHEG